ncbi:MULTISPECIES: urease subunit alpha [unclassified Dietzia]|uniref:urease subunit alpha n=1 Tax=unclassified Dietzia TaxID=2617939 RepID=UPI0015F9C330|nr:MULTISPECIES: urease subunit alpha [unclassified Dietzia]MBB1040206.1 urease subunit alpha [Dietzia sp. Cai40]MBB1043333.1 urease subunit alpha [Dietzia sp. DQ11-44]MBB1053369.1 urease subunit alpha [Dietzia sp. B44]MDZ4233723.1 urease subunit alpha [Dietzia sp.]
MTTGGTSLTPAARAQLYGPTTGDLVRLGDTSLLAEIEKDYTHHGYELTVGAGKNMRDGEALSATVTTDEGALDVVIQNALIIDAVQGIVKADIGIRDGRIVGIGNAGNPATMPGIDPNLVCGQNTTSISAQGCIVTAGAIESHGHMFSAEQSEHALAGGTTTLIGSSPGPVFDVGSGTAHVMGRYLQGTESSPVNFGLLARGGSDPSAVAHAVKAGAIAVKVHEDFGASPETINGSLIAADRHDFAVHLHTDSINEFGFAEDTMAAIGDRTIHMYHVEGAGGGHSPDILSVVSYPNVIPGSTNPTNPFAWSALEEGVPMTLIGHQMDPRSEADVAFAEGRIRPQTMSAEDLLHDIGAISIFGSDTQGMGRLAENVTNSWQLASVMRDHRGRLPEETTGRADNERIKRYVAKTTLNPAIAVGIDKHVGSVQPGRMADLVLWPFESFGVKPVQVLKAGMIVWAKMGDAAGSLMMTEPQVQRLMWGGRGSAKKHVSAVFVSDIVARAGSLEPFGLTKAVLPITSTRHLRKSDMVHNDALPDVRVDPRTFDVSVNGEKLEVHSFDVRPLTRKYMLR